VPLCLLQVVVFKLTSGELVFAFRGTEVDWSKGLREDALTNALFFQTPLNEMRGMEGRFPPKVKVRSCCCVCCAAGRRLGQQASCMHEEGQAWRERHRSKCITLLSLHDNSSSTNEHDV
jgi:hypothetical protein